MVVLCCGAARSAKLWPRDLPSATFREKCFTQVWSLRLFLQEYNYMRSSRSRSGGSIVCSLLSPCFPQSFPFATTPPTLSSQFRLPSNCFQLSATMQEARRLRSHVPARTSMAIETNGALCGIALVAVSGLRTNPAWRLGGAFSLLAVLLVL